MYGERMRELRQQLRLSQADLKDELNLRLGRSYDKPKVSRWENGREPIPDDVAVELEAMGCRKPRDARAIVLANQKGGVGKTTSALNLGRVCQLDRGRRTMAVSNRIEVEESPPSPESLPFGAALPA